MMTKAVAVAQVCMHIFDAGFYSQGTADVLTRIMSISTSQCCGCANI